MSTICSSVKLTPPSAKKGRTSIDWQGCIICQVFTTEWLYISTTKGRSTFISAVNKRKDEVYRKLVDEYTTVENAPFGNTKYHKSCYKAFTSKQNLSTCSNFKSTRPTSASCNQNPSSNEDNFTIVTRSRASEIDWTACIFCKHKAFKHDRKRDEQQVADLISHLQKKLINQFDIQQHPPELIKVSTGLKASKEVQESLLESVDTGNAMVKTFVGSALSVGKTGSLYGPIQRSNFKTFSDMNKKTKLKCRQERQYRETSIQNLYFVTDDMQR